MICKPLSNLITIATSVTIAVLFQNCGQPNQFSADATAKASTSPLGVTPMITTVDSAQTVLLTAAGGTPPYQFSVTACPGTIDFITGLFTGGSTPGTCPVTVTDASGATTNALVTVLAPPPPAPTYSWVQGGWGTCSTTCGGGTQSQTVVCESNSNVVAGDSLCTAAKPPTSQACNQQACPAVTLNVSSSNSCVNGYCKCVTPGQIGVPSTPSALTICQAAGYATLVSFTTSPGPVGAVECDPVGTGCFVNANQGNVICSTVTCL